MKKLLLVLGPLLLTACFDFDKALTNCEANPALCLRPDAGQPLSETAAGDLACVDGADNDLDGLLDCADPDCDAVTCRPGRGACDVEERCADAKCPADRSTCPSGQYCDDAFDGGLCQDLRDAGVPCASGRECGSGTCESGVCCTTACQGVCVSCALPGSEGTCRPVAATVVCRPSDGGCDVAELCDGATCPPDRWFDAGVICRADAGPCDVTEVCTGQSPACPADVVAGTNRVCRPEAGPCDLLETCDGQRAACPPDELRTPTALCRDAGLAGPCDAPEFCTGASAQCPVDGFFDAGFICQGASCSQGQLAAPSTCTAAGVCTPGPLSTCNGYGCNGAVCRTSCATASDCASASAFDCDAGVCVPRPGLGAACSSPSTCSSGFCVDGVCCESACTDNCKRCNGQGLCVNRQAGNDPRGGCGALYTCDGQGGCNTNCNANNACSNACKAGAWCNGSACVPTKTDGTACTSNCECQHGACVDGFCCNTPCSGDCQTCASPPGQCRSFDAGTDPRSACGAFTCSGGAGCNTTCAGADGCSSECKGAAFCSTNVCRTDALAGALCTIPNSTCECAGGLTCLTQYVDADRDGFGTGAPTNRCGLQQGSSLTPGDCCDLDKDAYPGQTSFFPLPSRCMSWDYNCSGQVELFINAGTNACATTGACNTTRCSGTTGWLGNASPPCGQSGLLAFGCGSLPACAPFCPSCTSCMPISSSRQQLCH